VETCKSFKHRAAFFGVIAIIVLALVPVALAAKGGNSGGTASTGTLALAGANAILHQGDTLSFVGTTTAAQPNVELVCSQNGTVVYASLSGWYGNQTPVDAAGNFTTRNMTLSSQAWTGGPADCTATLYYISGLKLVTMATLPITVS
jgi:hypothetical protein